jgi:glycyl-tRNA synthetase beta chain
VLSSRLSDARFFWSEDVKDGFEPWLEKLNGVTFHAKLGAMAERVERIVALARELAPLVGADPDKAAEAARLAKADLASQMVGEFPELQGIMGGYYAREFGLDAEISDAIRDHYRPQGPGDAVPTAPLSVAVALADKLDTLVGFWLIKEKPTGSKDPFALRRAGLGYIRSALERGLSIELRGNNILFDHMRRFKAFAELSYEAAAPLLDDLTFDFLEDRLAVYLRDQGGYSLEVLRAAFEQNRSGFNVVDLYKRADALTDFLATEDGTNLLQGYKRAANILKAEEKKGPLPTGEPSRVAEPAEEGALYDALAALAPKLDAALAAEDFTGAMTALAALRAPVDAFFVGVLVNSDVPAERDNRLRLLQQVQSAMGRVADFSLVTG